MKWIVALFCIVWLAVFTSQSLVDLADVLLTITALSVAYRNHELGKLFSALQPRRFWLIWIFVLIVSAFLNFGLSNIEGWKELLEFRWILTLLSMMYLLSRAFDIKTTMKILPPLVLLLNLGALIFYLKNPEQRAGGILNAVMAFSHNIGMVFCLFTFLSLERGTNEKAWERVIKILVVLTSGLLVALTMTRGVWIGVASGILAASFLYNRKLSLKIFIAIALVFTGLILTNQNFYNRVFAKTVSETQSNDERIALWRGNWRIIEENPIWGVGYGQNKYHLRKYFDEMGYPQEQRISHAHNQYLQVWAGTGTLGLFVYLWFLWIVVKEILKSVYREEMYDRMIAVGGFAAVVCFLVGALTEANFNIAKNRLLFLLIIAMSTAMLKRSAKPQISR